MPVFRWVTQACVWLACLSTLSVSASAQSSRPSLRIVVIEGEDAVNIVQQRTAVAPVIEVRDRNDQPVAGAVVRFTIRAGRGSFGGARTLAASTNAAGRATALGLAPEGAGPLQIAASASFEGQTTAITITQTNVATAAQAAALGGAGASGGTAAAGAGAATGGAAGSGAAAGGAAAGGLSTTTLVVAVAAAAGGAYAVKTVVDKNGAAAGDLKGSYDFRYDRIFRNNQTGAAGCGYTVQYRGTVTLSSQGSTGTLPADFDMNGTETVVAVASTCGPSAPSVGQSNSWGIVYRVTGSSAAFSGSTSRTSAFTGGSITEDHMVSGSVSGTTATVTVTKTDTVTSSFDTGRGTGSTTITLQ